MSWAVAAAWCRCFERQLARGGPLTITDPGMTRFFMTIPEAVFLVLQAGGLATPGNLFVLDMGEPVASWTWRATSYVCRDCRLTTLPMSFTGLRPGEKRTEELWVPGSIVERATEQVLRVREPVEPLRGEALLALTSQLIEDAQAGESDAVGAALRTQVMGMTGAAHSAGGEEVNHERYTLLRELAAESTSSTWPSAVSTA